MKAAASGRFAAWLAGVWAGAIAAIGFVVAPVLFANLARADAGRIAARLFEIDAQIGLAAGVILLVLAIRGSDAMRPAGASRFSGETMLALGAIFCIVAGHFTVQPMMEAAHSGEGRASFAVLHGVSSAFFLLKFVLVATLAWRTTARRAATTAAPPS